GKLMRGLEGKRVLITGGASGIGAATAARFLKEGSAVVVLDRDSPARERIRHELPELAGTVDADVSDFKQVQAALEDAVRLMGGVDVLINNAGISIRHNFLDITPEEWDKVIAVNLTGVFYMAQAAAQHMWEREGGVILQTASTNGIMGYPFYADYNATKAGVIELTRSMVRKRRGVWRGGDVRISRQTCACKPKRLSSPAELPVSDAQRHYSSLGRALPSPSLTLIRLPGTVW